MTHSLMASLAFVSASANVAGLLFNSVIINLFQTALPLELPQVKPKRNDEGKGLGMQLKGPLGPGGKGSIPELKPATAGCPMYLGNDSPRPGPSKVSQKPASPPPSAADHLEEELDRSFTSRHGPRT